MIDNRNPAAVALGTLGGKAGRGPAKSRRAQVLAWWDSPAGLAERARRRKVSPPSSLPAHLDKTPHIQS